MDRPTEADRVLISALAHRKRRSVFAPFVPPGKAKRKHKKRHSVNRERSREMRQKNVVAQDKQAAHMARRGRIAATVRAYFAGEIDDLSTIAGLLS